MYLFWSIYLFHVYRVPLTNRATHTTHAQICVCYIECYSELRVSLSRALPTTISSILSVACSPVCSRRFKHFSHKQFALVSNMRNNEKRNDSCVALPSNATHAHTRSIIIIVISSCSSTSAALPL